jgi:hypothetical protein
VFVNEAAESGESVGALALNTYGKPMPMGQEGTSWQTDNVESYVRRDDDGFIRVPLCVCADSLSLRHYGRRPLDAAAPRHPHGEAGAGG